jgi:hypothetical protein
MIGPLFCRDTPNDAAFSPLFTPSQATRARIDGFAAQMLRNCPARECSASQLIRKPPVFFNR